MTPIPDIAGSQFNVLYRGELRSTALVHVHYVDGIGLSSICQIFKRTSEAISEANDKDDLSAACDANSSFPSGNVGPWALGLENPGGRHRPCSVPKSCQIGHGVLSRGHDGPQAHGPRQTSGYTSSRRERSYPRAHPFTDISGSTLPIAIAQAAE